MFFDKITARNQSKYDDDKNKKKLKSAYWFSLTCYRKSNRKHQEEVEKIVPIIPLWFQMPLHWKQKQKSTKKNAQKSETQKINDKSNIIDECVMEKSNNSYW